MTDEEKELILMLNDVYERFASLPVQHHSDMDEFVQALHILQHLVMIRCVRRGNPEMFPLQLTASPDGGMDTIKDAIMSTIGTALDKEKEVKDDTDR